MTHSGKPTEPKDRNARFYVLFNEISRADEGHDQSGFGFLPGELEEIDQVMHMVTDIDDEPPQFMTST